MDWQQIVSLLIVAGAVIALLWAQFRPRKFSFERDTHCGCSATSSTPQRSSVIFHARKGENPQVIVKMK